MKRSLSRRLWPYGVVLLVLFSWDRAGWLYLSPRDEGRAAGFTTFPMWAEEPSHAAAVARAQVGEKPQPKAASMIDSSAKSRIERRPWLMLAYVFGRYEPWLILSAWLLISGVGAEGTPEESRAVFLRRVHQAVLLTGSILLAGLLAELMRTTIRRIRPEYTDGWFVYIPFWRSTPPDVSFGMPSSHAAVAFAAAIAIGRMVPSTRWALYPLAFVCALSRVLVGAHFLSDVYIGAMIGVLGERVIYAMTDGYRGEGPR